MAKRVFKSAVIGMLASICLGALAFALAPYVDAVGFYARLGFEFLPLFPSRVVYWVDPEGGPVAAIPLVVLCALFFWSGMFGTAHFGWESLRRKRS